MSNLSCCLVEILDGLTHCSPIKLPNLTTSLLTILGSLLKLPNFAYHLHTVVQ